MLWGVTKIQVSEFKPKEKMLAHAAEKAAVLIHKIQRRV